MIRHMFQGKYICAFVLGFLILPQWVLASDVSVRPFLIDEVVEARQYLSKEVVVTNTTNRRLNVYATVNEITVDTAGEIKEFVSPVMSDRTNTPASWVEVGRGRIEIEPGESTTIPVGFRIHPNVAPGEYHVFLGFGAASKRYEVERAAKQGNVDGVIVKLTVEDTRTEYVKIAGFTINRFITSDEERTVSVELENLGDIAASPTGEIIFFDSRGREISAVPVKAESLAIPPGETATIEATIPIEDSIGRFKANLALQYGTKQTASLFDSTQFFLLPFHFIILLLLIALFISITIVFLIHRAYVGDHSQSEEGDEVPLYVKDGHSGQPQDHDIHVSK